jgi:hypothetical protein
MIACSICRRLINRVLKRDDRRCRKRGALENVVTVRTFCFVAENGQFCFRPKERFTLKKRPESSIPTI